MDIANMVKVDTETDIPITLEHENMKHENQCRYWKKYFIGKTPIGFTQLQTQYINKKQMKEIQQIL